MEPRAREDDPRWAARKKACLEELARAASVSEVDPERAGCIVDDALMALIDDPDIKEAVDCVETWRA